MNIFENAPDWAEYFAINSDGMGFYYAIQPIKRTAYWSDGNMNLSCFAGKFDPKNWEVSLQKNMKKIFNSAKPSCKLVVNENTNIDELLDKLNTGRPVGKLATIEPSSENTINPQFNSLVDPFS
ncbi:hypothetical protein OY033_002384 [Shigella flexneri]|nr:hypothetical protein [Shigella flexneri]